MWNGPPYHEPQARRIGAWTIVATVLLVLALAVLFGRVLQLKLDPDALLADAAGSPETTRIELARRGDLLDRRGRIIATSVIGYRLFVDPLVVDDLPTVAADLAHVLGVDPVEIDRRIHERPESRYVVIRDLLDDWEVDALRQANLRGVGLEPRLARHYPNRHLAAGVVGKVGFEHEGLSGLEYEFNRTLQAQKGRLTYLRDARRRPLWIEPDQYLPAANGESVRLSIDLIIQDIVERRLRRAVDEFNAGGARAIVLDCRTGEILAMGDVLNPRAGWEEQTTDPVRALDPALARNRCVTDPYEPGSTFKPFVWSVATALGKARLDEVLPTPEHTGHRTSYGRLIRDAHYYGPSTWLKVLVKSMNSGMAIVAERLTFAEMQDAISRFGFGRKSESGLPGETAGIVTPPEKWSKYTQSSVAFGHEIAVTPLQMVRAFSVFARDGSLPALRITAVRAEERDYRFVHRVLPEDVVQTAREAMRRVMIEGTGRRSQSERYQLFGKSGTAQLPKKDGGGYHEDRYVASFIAGAPFTDPRIVVLCVIDDPDKSTGFHEGGKTAGPCVRDIIDETLGYLGVRPDQPAEGTALAAAD